MSHIFIAITLFRFALCLVVGICSRKQPTNFAPKLTVFGFWEYRITLPKISPTEMVVMHISAKFEKNPLRAPAWEHWESCDSDYFGTLFIFRLKIPFGELYLKITILSCSVSLFSKKIRKFENAVKVRFPLNGMHQITRKDETFV